MGSNSSDPKAVRFGVFEVDFAAAELRKRGRRIKLEAQPFQVLSALVRRPGELVSREELRKELWPEDTFVEFDHSLNTAVKKIRQALDDSPQNPRYIETAPRQGYRFVGVVEKTAAASPELPPPTRAWRRTALFAGVGVVAVLATAVMWSTRGEGYTAGDPTITPLTAYPGAETQPTFSPDGSHVAFTWSGPNQDNFDVYATVIGQDTPMRLTTNPAMDCSPAWSPDGSRIAFLRSFPGGKVEVYTVSPLGGQARRVAELKGVTFPIGGPYLAWHADGEWLAAVDEGSGGGPVLTLVSIDGRKRRLPQSVGFPSALAFSPAGDHLAFIDAGDLCVLSFDEDLTASGELRHVALDASSVTWGADGREIIYSAGPRQRNSLYRLDISRNSEPEGLRFGGEGVSALSVMPGRYRLVFDSGAKRVNIWEFRRNSGESSTRSLIHSTRLDHLPRYSPDGRKVLFSSTRSGTQELWWCDANGENAVRLTEIGSQADIQASWSPDGRRIAFAAEMDGQRDIFVMDAVPGSFPKRITGDPARDSGTTWSNDGKWIYFGSDRNGKMQVWRIPAGGGDAEPTTASSAGGLQVSPDGRWLYYAKGRGWTSSVWRRRADQEGGEEFQVLPSVRSMAFSVVDSGIYFIEQPGPGGLYLLQYFNFADETTSTLHEIRKDVMFGFTVSPDEKSILYAVAEFDSDLMLVENFR